ncbi:hypothetical protein NM688_g3297 [Phlebia brevispora]|uniref:Uncharacterized protein n=1 Tax=Phlebia brevispora TaxID=194682 RepID=A0ACC1T6J3_9APHY|nr:hypothetical protein NM688_g3297 [Phlebia brevispora]
MAAYFLITFLLVLLVPLTLSSPTVFKQKTSKEGCPCEECIKHRSTLKQGFFNPKARRRTIFLLIGWTLCGFLTYKAVTSKVENKVYNPFEILDISTSATTKDIKSHYKKLSRKFHPDKVKLTENQTMESVEAYFVEITKAYKALTDEVIRQNWERYGHPDGRQEVTMGIALPKWIVEGPNRNWVLAGYGIIFGGLLPAFVGNWWFGNRDKTKDGVKARSAAAFFKGITEESGMDDVVGALGKSFEWERPEKKTQAAELDELEKTISQRLGDKWSNLKRIAEVVPEKHEVRRRAFILLYAHLLRLPVSSSALRAEQAKVLLQIPTLLNSLLNISISRNWLFPTLAVLRLHSYLAQALVPGDSTVKYAQLPGIEPEEAKKLSREASAFDELVDTMQQQKDGRTGEIKKAMSRWGRLDLVDASFKVIGERVVTPMSFVFLVVKLRIVPPTAQPIVKDEKEPAKKDDLDEKFLLSRKESEDMPKGAHDGGWAHAPHWPANRKPGWWLVLADPKIGRVIVPPMRITDVPITDGTSARDYRSYKLQFQAPPVQQTPLTLTWKLYLISDTFVGEEVSKDMKLTISAPLPETVEEDEISDPEEDSLAGQMAMMRGGKVKKRGEEESDDESTTDDDKESDSDSSSDSD